MTFYEIAQTLKALHGMLGHDGSLADNAIFNAIDLIWISLHKAGDAESVQKHMDGDGLYPYLKQQGFFANK
tara:strand:+ start:90 stop:302 length:213 start_codon:yes stop_codon:yes gene_type:complete